MTGKHCHLLEGLCIDNMFIKSVNNVANNNNIQWPFHGDTVCCLIGVVNFKKENQIPHHKLSSSFVKSTMRHNWYSHGLLFFAWL